MTIKCLNLVAEFDIKNKKNNLLICKNNELKFYENHI